MTHTERTRFIILIILLILLVGIGFAVQQARKSGKVGADLLGEIKNQAVASFKDKDGNEMEPTLSDESSLLVASGKNQVTITYKLQSVPNQQGQSESVQNQNADIDVEIYRVGEDKPLVTYINKKGQNGTLFMNVLNLANGTYHFAIKPKHHLAQRVENVSYTNGTPVVIDFKDPFLWGDIDITHDGKGDNGDNKINSLDWTILANAWASSEEKTDWNGDGTTNSLDAAILLSNWGKPAGIFDVDQLRPSPSPIPDSDN